MSVEEIKKAGRVVYRNSSDDGFLGKIGTAVQAVILIAAVVCLAGLMIR